MSSRSNKIFLWSFMELPIILKSLSKSDLIEFNKEFQRKTKRNITNLKTGQRQKPLTYDWRDDSTIINVILMEQPQTVLRALGNFLLEHTYTCSAEDFQNYYENAETEAWRAPISMILKAVTTIKEFDEFTTKINAIRDCCYKHSSSFTTVGVTQSHIQALEGIKPNMKLSDAIKAFSEAFDEVVDSMGDDETIEVPNADPSVRMALSTNSTQRDYIGYIRLQNGSFFNFYPTARVVDGEVIPVSLDEAQATFPSHGALALVKNFYRDGLTKNLIDNYFYQVALETDDLENNQRDDYEIRVKDFHQLHHGGRFKSIHDMEAYFVVYPIAINSSIDETKALDLNTSIYVTFNKNGTEDAAKNYTQRFDVVLAYGDKFLGPVPLIEDANGRHYVNFRSGTKNGEIDCFEGKNLEKHVLNTMIFVHDAERGQYCYRDILFTRKAGVTRSAVDALDDQALLQRMAEQSKQFDKKMLPSILKWLENTALDSDLLGSNAKIRASRQERLAHVISTLERNKDNVGQFASVITNCLAMAKDDKTGFFDALALRIAKDPIALEHLKEYKAIQEQMDVLETQKRNLEDSIEEKSEELKKIDATFQKQQRESLDKALIALNKEKERAENELQALLKHVGDVKDLSEANVQLRRLEEKIKDRQRMNTWLEEETENLNKTLLDAVKKDKIAKLAFEPAIAHKFSEAASLWVAGQQEDVILQKQDLLSVLPMSELEGNYLVQYLLTKTSQYRAYDHNAILNLYICMAQSFLTVFSGMPGCGKTSICNIMAKVLGLNSYSERAQTTLDLNRFLPVSVERGWTSKRDFLGYYNPLSKRFESLDDKRRECFVMLDHEAQLGSKTHPYMILLDEANLSQMEYYWADFMNICDARNAMSHINLGDGHQYRIPNTLRFMATINNDQTTEMLSPRLIDRSFVVTLPDPVLENYSPASQNDFCDDGTDDSLQLINWNALQTVFGVPYVQQEVARYEDKINALMDSLIKQMKALGINVSARSYKAMMDYIWVATYWFEADDTSLRYSAAIDYAVAQKLLPCISLVGVQHERSLQDLLNFCETNDLTHSATLLTDIIRRGKRNMNMFSFF